MPQLDSAISCLLPKPKIADSTNFTPDQSITSARYRSDTSANTLTVIIPPWHASPFEQNRLVRSELKKGRAVLEYSLHESILSADPQQTITVFETIADRVFTDVQAKSGQYKSVRYIASSLGCAILIYYLGTKKVQAQVDLIAPGSNLATSLWRGIRTSHLREAYEAQGLTEQKLRVLWKQLSPEYQAEHNIRGCDLRIFYSHHDLVILPAGLETMASVLRQHGNNLTMISNKRSGHFITIARYSIWPASLDRVAGS